MQEYNIRLKRYNGVDYDTLYPETKSSLLVGNIAKSQLASGATYTAVSTTLVQQNWNSSTLQQTISVSGVTPSNAVIVAPAPNDLQKYSESGIYCSAQASGSLTFKCEEIPASNIAVNVLILT